MDIIKNINTSDTSTIKKAFDIYNEKYFDNKVPYPDKFKWSNRLSSTGGKVCTKYRAKDKKILNTSLTLSVKHVKHNSNCFKDILVHEMIHLLHNGDGHGQKFKNEMNRLNRDYKDLNITQYLRKEYILPDRYKFKCSGCGRVTYANVRKDKKYICGNCNGDIVLLEDRWK